MSHPDRPQATRLFSGSTDPVCLLPHFSDVFSLHQPSVASCHGIFLDSAALFRQTSEAAPTHVQSNLHRVSTGDSPGPGAVQHGS